MQIQALIVNSVSAFFVFGALQTNPALHGCGLKKETAYKMLCRINRRALDFLAFS